MNNEIKDKHFLKQYFFLINLTILILPISFIFLGVNFSLADFILPITFIYSVIAYLKKCTKIKIIKIYNLFFLFFLLFMLISLIQYFKYSWVDNKVFFSGLISIVKIIICGLYGFSFLTFYFTSLKNQNSIQKAKKCFLISISFVSLTCIIGVILYYIGFKNNPFVYYGFRARGVMYDPNLAAIFLLISVIYLLYLLSIATNNKKKIRLLLLITILALILTSSKAGILMLLFTLFITFLYSIKSKKMFKNVLILFILLFLGFSLIYTKTNYLNNIINRLNTLFSDDAGEITTGRSDIWKNAFYVISLDNNFFTGVGIGNFENYCFYNNLSTVMRTHNTFLSFFVELGFIPAALFLFCITYILINTFYITIKSKKSIYFFSFISALVLFIFMFEINIQNFRYLYLVFTLILFNLYSNIKVKGAI